MPCCAQDRLAQILVDAELQALAHQILAQGGTKGDKKGEKAKAGAAAAGGSSKHLLGPAWWLSALTIACTSNPVLQASHGMLRTGGIQASQLMQAARHTNTALRSACVREWADSSRAVAAAGKRQQPEAAAPAAPASTGGGKKQRSSSGAAAAAAVEPAPASAAARKAGRGPQQPAAAAAAGEAAVGGAGGSNPSRPAGRAAAAAASGGAAASDSAAVSPAEFEGLVRDVCRDADRHAKRVGGSVGSVCCECAAYRWWLRPCMIHQQMRIRAM